MWTIETTATPKFSVEVQLRIKSLELAVAFCAGCPGTPTGRLIEIAGTVEKYIMEAGNGKDS